MIMRDRLNNIIPQEGYLTTNNSMADGEDVRVVVNRAPLPTISLSTITDYASDATISPYK